MTPLQPTNARDLPHPREVAADRSNAVPDGPGHYIPEVVASDRPEATTPRK